jgi:hypothetical protein
MPTSRELKALLRPLLERRRDLGFARRNLFFVPLNHYARGVVFVAYWSSNAAEVVSFACPLYDGAVDVHFNGGPEHCHWKDDLEKTSRELCDKIEQYSLPPVEKIVDFERHLEAPAYLPGSESERCDSPQYVFWAALTFCASGAHDSAEKILERVEAAVLHFPSGSLTEGFRFGDFRQRFLYLLHLLRTDRSRILPLLHEWEAFKVNACKMTRYWKPSPFPCELLR